MALIDFTLSNARGFYSSMGNPLRRRGLTTWKAKNVPVKVESQCEGTLCDDYLSQHICNYFAVLDIFLQVQYFWSNITHH